MPEKRLLIVAGDPSGDRHGAALVKALKAKHPDLKVAALGGNFLKEVVDVFIHPLVGMGGFGFWEPLFKIPQFWNLRQQLKGFIVGWKPDMVIPIDYYGFNIHVARLAKGLHIPVYYYISPQVWASRPQRIGELGKNVAQMLVIFPFEEKLYRDAGVPATFVGHPLPDQLPEPTEKSEIPSLGLLPGSRRSVIARHLPIVVDTAIRIREKNPHFQIYLFRPKEIEPAFYAEVLERAPWIRLTDDPDYSIRKRLWLAISVSGTAALENMLLGIPMIIMYKLSWLTYQIAKQLIRVPYIGIPNLLAGKPIIPELIQADAHSQKLADIAQDLISQDTKRAAMQAELLALRQTLASGGSTRTADVILSALT